MTIPTFPQFLSRCMLVCSRTGCLFIAPEKYAKGANSKGDLLERWAGRLRSSFYFNPQCLMSINHHLIPPAQRAETCAPPFCCTLPPHTLLSVECCCQVLSRQSPDYKSVCRTCLPAAQSPPSLDSIPPPMDLTPCPLER